ncbi:class I SAM-dependent methyltransferase, partial [Streptomyces sp. NPDC005146]
RRCEIGVPQRFPGRGHLGERQDRGIVVTGVRANLGTDVVADFLVGDGMADVPPGSVDLVLNNPPFHSHQATTDATARTMFHGARTALRQGGELWVVGNRHLGYHTQLRRTFGNCTTVAGDPKFVVLRAVKR